MNNYDFQNLSPIEFESLVHDLLEADFKIKLERFTVGRDEGIDLRYSKGAKKIIVQCKRYKNFGSLYSNLRIEVSKVVPLKPSRYIVATSTGLTPLQKTKIKKLFKSYILNNSDIIGKEELNDLLNSHEDIERRHFKLWLSSTNILEKILHSKVYNQSEFELETIREYLNIYVENESFNKALEIVKKHNYVIISGIPGIGKTTLARMLSYYLLANGFDEFVFLSDSINEGYQFFKSGKRQIFLFDDFLGANFLQDKLQKNEERRIVDFIKEIQKSKNKALILTTREYILNQARAQFEVIERAKWNTIKYTLDLSKYTMPIRARILYNHLYFSELPRTYITDLLIDHRYLGIISHKNYSPRIIQAITQQNTWEVIKPEDFYKTFKRFLDNPQSIWQHVFDKQISNLSRWILLILATAGTPIILEDLRSAVKDFIKKNATKYNLQYNVSVFNESLDELEDTFIAIDKDSKDNFIINYNNPSIYDFLKKYIEDNNELIVDLINSAQFFNQFFTIFSFKPGDNQKIFLESEVLNICKERILKEFDYFGRSSLIQVSYSDNSHLPFWSHLTQSDLYKINEILKEFDIDKFPDIKLFVLERMKQLDFSNVKPEDQWSLISILKKIGDSLKNESREIIIGMSNHLETINDVDNFVDLKSVYKEEFDAYVEASEISKTINKIIDIEIDSSKSGDRGDLLSTIEGISNRIDLEMVEEAIDTLREMIEEDEQNHIADIDYLSDDHEPIFSRVSNVDSEIIDMFDTLKEK